MKARIGRRGNRPAPGIPPTPAARVGLTFDSTVEPIPGGGALVISAVKPPASEPDVLLAGVTESNLHGEADTGPPVGGEAW